MLGGVAVHGGAHGVTGGEVVDWARHTRECPPRPGRRGRRRPRARSPGRPEVDLPAPLGPRKSHTTAVPDTEGDVLEQEAGSPLRCGWTCPEQVRYVSPPPGPRPPGHRLARCRAPARCRQRADDARVALVASGTSGRHRRAGSGDDGAQGPGALGGRHDLGDLREQGDGCLLEVVVQGPRQARRRRRGARMSWSRGPPRAGPAPPDDRAEASSSKRRKTAGVDRPRAAKASTHRYLPRVMSGVSRSLASVPDGGGAQEGDRRAEPHRQILQPSGPSPVPHNALQAISVAAASESRRPCPATGTRLRMVRSTPSVTPVAWPADARRARRGWRSRSKHRRRRPPGSAMLPWAAWTTGRSRSR